MKKSNMMLLVTATVLIMSSFTTSNVFNASTEKGESYTLRFNPEKGTSGTMVMDYSMKISLEMMGQSMDMDQRMEMGAKVDVAENTATEITTHMSYEYFAMNMKNPMMGEMAYDSRKEVNEGMLGEQLDGAFKDVIGKQISITQDKSGKTLRSEGMDDMVGVNKSQGNLDFSSVMAMSQFPDHPVKVGDSWTNIMDDAASPMKMEAKMTLTDVRNGKVYVSFQSVVSSNDKFDMGKALDDAGAETEEAPDLDISGTQNGTFIYNQATMWLIEGMIKQDLQMKVEQMGMEIPMKVKGDMLLTME